MEAHERADQTSHQEDDKQQRSGQSRYTFTKFDAHSSSNISRSSSQTFSSPRKTTVSPPTILRHSPSGAFARSFRPAFATMSAESPSSSPTQTMPQHLSRHIPAHTHFQEMSSPTQTNVPFPQAQNFASSLQPLQGLIYPPLPEIDPRQNNLRLQHWVPPFPFHNGYCTPIAESPHQSLQDASPLSGTLSPFFSGHSQLYEFPTKLRPSSATSIDSIESYESVQSSPGSQSIDNKSKAVFRPITAALSGGEKNTRKTTSSPTYTQVSSGGDEDSKEGKSPLPQNLRGDPFRSAKVKTELCRHFNTEKGCPFGDKCNYAHGEHELKYTKLMDLERAGLVDIEVFRSHPCVTWVATGACPFDQRCMCLHDPRIAGLHSCSWLPHAETLINGLGSSANVDKLYHQRLASVYSCCPLYGYVPVKKWKENEDDTNAAWKHFYNFVCNNNQNFSTFYSRGDSKKNILDNLSEIHVLDVVLRMRERKLGQSYAYFPTHMFCGELCMILQKRHFQLIPMKDRKSMITYILEELQGDKLSHSPASHRYAKQFTTYEIVFGPVGDPSVRPLSVWFDIPTDDIIKCTSQQAKRHKRSRHRLKKNRRQAEELSTAQLQGGSVLQSDSQLEENSKQVDSTRIPPFYHYQPHDDSTFDLITHILRHRLGMLRSKAGHIDAGKNSHQIKRSLKAEDRRLKAVFISLRRHWMTWSWPAMSLKGEIDNNTDVPPVNEEYAFVVGNEDNFQTKIFFGENDTGLPDIVSSQTKLVPAFLWKSFINNIQLIRGDHRENKKEKDKDVYDLPFSRLRRLPALRSLSLGKELNVNRVLHHLNNITTVISDNKVIDSSEKNITIESLFLEWKIVEAHYDKSLSGALRVSQPSKEDFYPTDGMRSIDNEAQKNMEIAAQSKTRMPL